MTGCHFGYMVDFETSEYHHFLLKTFKIGFTRWLFCYWEGSLFGLPNALLWDEEWNCILESSFSKHFPKEIVKMMREWRRVVMELRRFWTVLEIRMMLISWTHPWCNEDGTVILWMTHYSSWKSTTFSNQFNDVSLYINYVHGFTSYFDWYFSFCCWTNSLLLLFLS